MVTPRTTARRRTAGRGLPCGIWACRFGPRLEVDRKAGKRRTSRRTSRLGRATPYREPQPLVAIDRRPRIAHWNQGLAVRVAGGSCRKSQKMASLPVPLLALPRTAVDLVPGKS